MEAREPPHVIATKSTSSKPSIFRKFLFPRSQSSYNGIIIAVCVAILLWMILHWEYKNAFKDSNKYVENIHKTVLETARDIGKNVKNSYQESADAANATIHETISKIKNAGGTEKPKSSSVQETLKEASDNVIQKTKETIEALKDKTQETHESFKDKSQHIIDNIKEASQATVDKLMGTQTTVEHRFEMTGLIDQGLLTLQEFLSPHLAVEEQIPIKILSGAKGVVFLTVLKGGVGISGAVGTGFVISLDEKGKWSGPCCILLAGIDIGLNIGIEKSDHIIILRDESAVRAFGSIGQLKLGLDVSIAAGPKGRDASIGLSVGNKGHAATFSYSLAQGAYLGLSLEGQIITVRHDCNEQYYGKQVEPSKILDGSIKAPKNKNLKATVKLLNGYVAQKEEI